MKLGLICGMEVEARALGRLRDHVDLAVGISAAQPDRATALSEQMVRDGVDCLISWGIAGGLSPKMPAGALLIPEVVVDMDGNRLPLAGVRPVGSDQAVVLAGSDVIVPTVQAKAAMLQATGADAVDMETHRIARVAAARGLPCFAIRAVSDPFDRALPPGTEAALDEAGRPRVVSVLSGLLRHPSRLPALLRAKRDLDCAVQTLSGLGVGLVEDLLQR